MFFFISGINSKAEHIGNAPNVVCPQCGKFTCMHLTAIYELLSLFFIPVLKWNRRYLATAPCCNAVFDLEQKEGDAFRSGEKNTIDPNRLHRKSSGWAGAHVCPNCGCDLPPNAKFCPQCGKSL